MKKELDEALCQKYPSLYRDRHGDKMETLMCWGFECGDGWYAIIAVISALLAEHNTDISCTQCKEKFGGLRFYLNFCDDYASGVVDIAEAISTATCEICGKPGTRYKGGWISTLCNEHRSDEKFPEHDASLVNGIGLGWSRLLVLLQEKADWDTEHNNRPKTTFNFSKVDNQLHIAYSGGNDETQGMVDFVIHYAQRIDEHSGFPVQQ